MSEVLVGEQWLNNRVNWVVSLRPYPPAFPRLNGQELALIATEYLARLEPSPSMSEVISQLASRETAAIAIRGSIDNDSLVVASQLRMPLLKLQSDAQLYDIEQAVMRRCAMSEALAEARPLLTPEGWLRRVLEGTLQVDTQTLPLSVSESLANYAIAYLPNIRLQMQQGKLNGDFSENRRAIALSLNLISTNTSDGLAILIPEKQQAEVTARVLVEGYACGFGRLTNLQDLRISFSEAQIAATVSLLLRNNAPVDYSKMDVDLLLVHLYSEAPQVIVNFVECTLAPLTSHDKTSGVPLLPTVAAYVQHGGKLRETASALHVHRNTLAYRLERASETLGRDLHDSNARFAIEVALRCLPLTL